jgi:hypothetical protein
MRDALSRLHMTELWCVLQEIAPAQCCSAKLLQLMLAAYDGSLSAVDTLLLDGIRRAEPICGVSLVSDEFAFGRLLRHPPAERRRRQAAHGGERADAGRRRSVQCEPHARLS